MKAFALILMIPTLLSTTATASSTLPAQWNNTSPDPAFRASVPPASYAHGTCSFHATILQNCCKHLPSDHPKHCTYLRIPTIKDNNGNAINGLWGVNRDVELHPGMGQTPLDGPVIEILGMGKEMEYKWYEWVAKCDNRDCVQQKITYRFDNYYWDEDTAQAGQGKPHCNRGAWTADGVCRPQPYRRTHDMDCWFPC